MLEEGESISRNNPTTLFSFKPRQVVLLLANLQMKSEVVAVDNKKIIHHSICRYFKLNGFSKTFKKFVSEAKLDLNENLDGDVLDLEEVLCKQLEAIQMDKPSKQSEDKKKKKSKLPSGNVEHKEPEALPVMAEEKYKDKASAVDEDGLISNENKPKEKKKKKAKSTSEFVEVEKEVGVAKQIKDVKDSQESEATENKSIKSKGKKKDNSVFENGNMEEFGQKKSSTKSEKDDNQNTEEEVTNKEKKGSKKRKRASGENDDPQPVDNVLTEESKSKKTENKEKTKEDDQIAKQDESLGSDEPYSKKSKGENGNVSSNENGGDKFSNQKPAKKQRNGSAEPTTVKAFQRVKLDEVVFTDERLQDNSYWAKDGAETGYGAKAQEVLGQVRGKDFRHEKTKKKRGSYRGGQIDLQSHSVKFNYSDDE